MPPPEATATLSRREVARSGTCIGCGACAGGSSGVAMRLDRLGHLKPAGGAAALAQRSALLAQACPFSPHSADETQLAQQLFGGTAHADPRIGRYRSAWVGYAAEEPYRAIGSSGGLVSWVAAELLRTGQVDGVAHVLPCDPAGGRLFEYRISRSLDELRAGAKSRYYPVELSAVLDEMRRRPGRYALVGIPCFVKAAQLARRADPVLRERLRYTLGLFCGHMKSARMVESFARQMGARPSEVRAVDFRIKDPSRPARCYTAGLQMADGRTLQRDWTGLAEGDWGSGFFQNRACDACSDVVAETADISFGDAWVEPYASDGRGTNVVVVRSAELHAVLEHGLAQGRLHLSPVDADFVVQTQAAGFRQRREGLAYRQRWWGAPAAGGKRSWRPAGPLAWRRKLIYRLRASISRWSQRLFLLSPWPAGMRAYLVTSRAMLALYHGAAYSRGRIGRLLDRLSPRAVE